MSISMKVKRAWLFDLPPGAVRTMRVVAVGASAVGTAGLPDDPRGDSNSDSDSDSGSGSGSGNARGNGKAEATDDHRAAEIEAQTRANTAANASAANAATVPLASRAVAGLSCAHCARTFDTLAVGDGNFHFFFFFLFQKIVSAGQLFST
jgi:hypothetical protein